ncbi:MAG: translation initiation factor IF-2 [Anaerolineae bacterium]|jgi:translation initiation factor IF-2
MSKRDSNPTQRRMGEASMGSRRSAIGDPPSQALPRQARSRRSGSSAPRSRGGEAPSTPRAPAPAAPEPKPESTEPIQLPEQITVRELAETLGTSPIELIKQLMNLGVMANINQLIDYETAAIASEELGFKVSEVQPEAEAEAEAEEEAEIDTNVRRTVYTEEEQRYLASRPPVITIMGHVDHGKTSLLDVIREASVQVSEAGGITQHIGAYQVAAQGKQITFLDTPGHEAFTEMRARGASVTDIAILVVAADDGVQPQTREAINHARAAHVPIIVALNKMDLPSANPDHVKQQLADVGLVPEDWGGDTIVVPVSAKAKQGIDTLLDMILLVAEMADFKANPRRNPQGTVIEGRLDRARGPIATLLVHDGILEVGDALVIGNTSARIRAMFDYRGQNIDKATPSQPVVIMGLRDVPQAGDRFEKVGSERIARQIAEERTQEATEAANRRPEALSLDDIYARAQDGAKSLNVILKADVQGSIDPIRSSLEQLKVGNLSVDFIHEGVGNIAESDVNLAVASEAVVIGFNVSVDASAQRMAEAEGIEIRTYDIIYRLIEDIQKALTGMLEPEKREVVQGRAVVRQVFSIPRAGKIAGVQVREGKALRNARVRVLRGEKELHTGGVSSLKRYTEDVREVSTGMECGVGVDGFNDFEADDILEFYVIETVERTA